MLPLRRRPLLRPTSEAEKTNNDYAFVLERVSSSAPSFPAVLSYKDGQRVVRLRLEMAERGRRFALAQTLVARTAEALSEVPYVQAAES